ncbi:MAG: hypothetical protein ACK5IQ_05835 [Bacteroidales bacterium]
MSRFLAIVLFVSLSMLSYGQQKKIFVIDGTVKVEKDDALGVVVRVTKNDQLINQSKLTKRGRVKFDLELNQEYVLEFDKTGCYGKKILVSTEVPAYVIDRGGDIDAMLIEVTLYKEQETTSRFNELDNAVGAIFFNQATQQFDNKIYLTPNHIKNKLKSMIAEIEKDKKPKEDNKESEEDLNKRKDYERFIAEADKQFEKDALEDAKTNYTKALNLYPDERYPALQIERINKRLQDRLNEAQRLKDIEERYKAQIGIADNLFKQEEYNDAKTAYTEALSIKPGDEYAINQIKECVRLGKLKEIEDKYKVAIAQADGYFNGEQYADAQAAYKIALSIKPGSEYPIAQLKKIEELLGNQAAQEKLEKLYAQAMENGDISMSSKNYESALSFYNKALTYKPGDEAATAKIKEAQKMLESEELNKRYKAVLAEADNAYKKQELIDALSKYKTASNMKPDEEYPKSRIAEIQGQLDQQKSFDALLAEAAELFDAKEYLQSKDKYLAVLNIDSKHKQANDRIKEIDEILAGQQLDEKYNEILKVADQYFASESYEDAIAKYEDALKVKPRETYPKVQINKAKAALDQLAKDKDRLRMQQEELDRRYQALIASADKAFDEKNYKASLGNYQEANKLKPEETYPIERIAEIGRILAEMNNLEQLISEADRLFSAQSYAEARSTYEKVLLVNPTHQHSKDRIALIDKILNDKDIEAKYAELISQADGQFNSKEYQQSIDIYRSALSIKPDEDYPKRQIEKAEAAMARLLSEKERQEKFDKLIARGDAQVTGEDYDEALNSFREAKSIIDNDLVNGRITDVLKLMEQLASKRDNEVDDSSIRELEERIHLQEKYNKLIIAANKYYKSKQYENALTNYEAALELKPDEKYPKDKIEEINRLLKLLEEQRALAAAADDEPKYDYTREIKPEDDGYEEMMGYAAKLYNSNMYKASLKYYDAANRIRPNQHDCVAQISHVESLISDTEADISQLVLEAKQAMNDNNWDVAISNFTAAKEKDKESDNDSKYDNLIALAQSKKVSSDNNTKYVESLGEDVDCATLILKSDAERAKGNYSMAKYYLTQAAKLEPSNFQVATGLEELAKESKNAKVQKVDNAYTTAISQADKAFANSQLGIAKFYYNQALKVYAGDAYASARIKELELLIEQNVTAEL